MPETYDERVVRIMHNHDVSLTTARRVATAEIRVEKMKAEKMARKERSQVDE